VGGPLRAARQLAHSGLSSFHPLLWLSLAFLAGIALANILPLSAAGWLLVAGACLPLVFIRNLALLLIVNAPGLPRSLLNLAPVGLIYFTVRSCVRLSRLRLPVPAFALQLALALGGARYQLSMPDPGDPGFIAYYNDLETAYQVEGRLLSPPEMTDRYARLRLEVESLRPVEGGETLPVRGSLLVTDWDRGEWSYGDRLRLSGILEEPPQGESFSYREYLRRQGVYSSIQPQEIELLGGGGGSPWRAALYRLRQRLLELTYRLYPDPEASLLAGILLGIESGIPAEVERAFQDSGTAHIIAISG